MTAEVALAQALVQKESLSRQESAATKLLREAMSDIGFDEAYLDDAGNAIGIYRRGEGPVVHLNGHLDTVALGDAQLWKHPPLSGTIESGQLWGRGSVDMKSAVACMAYAAQDAINSGFKGSIIVSGVVQEEIGGLGARHLGQTLPADVIILGEPSSLSLMLGHRGRVEVDVTLAGKIAHAAKNELGDNALYHAADLLHRLRSLELPAGGPLGRSTLTPTKLSSFPSSNNVVPGRAELVIDYRFIPEDSPEAILARLQALAPEASFRIQTHSYQSESGKVQLEYPNIAPAYLCPGENPYVTIARRSIRQSLSKHNLPYQERVWWFATDAPHLAINGAPVIGFGPGNEELAHTTQECVPIAQLQVARQVYHDLILALTA